MSVIIGQHVLRESRYTLMSPRGFMSLIFSNTVTECPLRWHSMAAVSPAKPAPTIITLTGPDEDDMVVRAGAKF
jgi:hypothetical protein